jgi:hypothetical protein
MSPVYDLVMQRLNRATVAGLVLGLVGWASVAAAQINGIPPSVTSPGFGGRQVNGVPPSVTSLGPRGFTPNVPTCCFRGAVAPNTIFMHPHHHPHHGVGVVYGVPYYGYYDNSSDEAANTPDQSADQYNGGPTVFDRRGPGTAAPAPVPTDRASARGQAEPDASSDAQPESVPAPSQPQTLLVFKDGHQLEVANYAIVGSTLYDLTGGRRKKIELADLDLDATAKQNDDRGVDFQVPAGPKGN